MLAAPFKMDRVAAQLAPVDLRCSGERVSHLRHRSLGATMPAFHGCGRYVVYRCMSLVSDLDETECLPIAIEDEPNGL